MVRRLIAKTFLLPRVPMHMIAVAFPETGTVFSEEFEAAEPFGALPGVELGDDEAGGSAVFDAERLAVVVGSDEGVGSEEIGEGEVRRPAEIVAEGADEFCLGFGATGEFEKSCDRDAGPSVIEAGPAGDAVEIGEDFRSGESQEFFPGEGDFLLDQAKDVETPLGHVDGRWGTAGVENRPLDGLALTRRDALLAPGIGRNDHSGSSMSWRVIWMSVNAKRGIGGIPLRANSTNSPTKLEIIEIIYTHFPLS